MPKKLKIRLIAIRTPKEETITINPLDIVSITVVPGKEVILKMGYGNKLFFKKKDYLYPHWNYFLLQLNNFFDL